ncbi:unnamed protein product [Angiostrongylus costaricensis]|uniref:SURF6 domain-containing protein n=1 Tax=Angiostrongylus costaricensis TaxID=334426 RepID=A0A158PGF9_ANGCS|nr:unnamed protein product [Angiostrongylus costaricensis]
MSSPLLTASPTAPPSAPSSTKQPAFDDACFKTPLPFNRKPRRGRGATSTTGGTRLNGYHSSGSTRGGRVGRPSGTARVTTPAPPPPSPKFVLHDVICPHTAAYLGALNLPLYASIKPTNDAKEVVHCDGEKPSTSTNTVKEESVEDSSNPGSSPKVTVLENGDCKVFKEEIHEENNESGAATSEGPKEVKKESTDSSTDSSTDKLPFVEEMIFDEYSLLLFTRLSDAQLFEKELETVRTREELEKKRIAAEKAARIEKLKRKIRARKRLIEKAARLQRKRLRAQKREKLRRERRSQHSALKKTIREAKALKKAAAAAGRVVIVDKELKKQWKALQAADSRRREEKARKRVEHEVRKEARRAKRDKKRGRKRRNDPNKATAAKKGKDTAAAGGGLAIMLSDLEESCSFRIDLERAFDD